ncbi:MAG: RNA 2',3'-cyclic phosphodiesterase [Rhodospirillaceae bacterium]|nr:RNA 2',3'-cyclic phosphodiesterase [Rhodospirillaceae bacterium]
MLRLFVALPIPAALAERLALLGGGIPGARWVAPETMHITLRFIGEVAEADAEDIGHALSRVTARGFDVEIAGVDTFGQGRKARAIYARVALTPELEILQGRVEAAVAVAGQPRETRKFVPHVTLARLNNANSERLQYFIEGNSLLRVPPFRAEEFVLYDSRTGNGGPVYEPLAEYSLAD